MTTDQPQHPGAVWREIIELTGLTQAWVAGQMGISQKHLNQVVNQRAVPTARLTVAFANATNTDPVRIYQAQAVWEITQAIAEFKPPRPRDVTPPSRWAR